MTKRVYMYSHSNKSCGARLLAKAMGIKLLKHQGSSFIRQPGDRVVNWGATRMAPHAWNPTHGDTVRTYNYPLFVQKAVNKLSFFTLMRGEGGPRCPPWTTSREEAIQWLMEGHSVVCRKTLTGSQGKGIVVING